VEKFRGALPSTVLNSVKYSFTVFLVPRVTNRKSTSDAAIQFIHVDEASEQELERLEKLNVLIREKHIPIANLDMFKPGSVLREVKGRIPFRINMSTHTATWKYFNVRPSGGDPHPKRTQSEYCVYDSVHKDYLYTRAWVEKLVRELSDANRFKNVVGRDPVAKGGGLAKSA